MPAEDNTEIVRHAIRHLNEIGEPDWALYDAELVWTTRADGPAHMTYHGLEGLRRGITSLRSVWAEFNAEIEEITATDDRVLSVLRWRLRAHSGVERYSAWKAQRSPARRTSRIPPYSDGSGTFGAMRALDEKRYPVPGRRAAA